MTISWGNAINDYRCISYYQGSHTSEISKFPTISQLFWPSSPTSQPKLHGSHNFSEANFPIFLIFSLQIWLNYLAGNFLDPKQFIVDSQPLCTNWTNCQPIREWSRLNSQIPIRHGYPVLCHQLAPYTTQTTCITQESHRRYIYHTMTHHSMQL